MNFASYFIMCVGTYWYNDMHVYMVTFILFYNKPEITRQFLNKLMVLLPLLKEAPLLLIARVFDPSRQFIKQFLEKSDLFRRKR